MEKINSKLKQIIMYVWLKITQLFPQNRIKEIYNMKNKFMGKRVFIVATGPSLTIQDLDLIKNEYSISMNSIISAFDKTDYRPTFYLTQDAEVIKKLTCKINESDLTDVFVGIGNSHLMKLNVTKKLARGITKRKVYYNLNSNYHYYDMCFNNKKNIRFSADFSQQSYDGYTVAYSAIQLAYFLGFTEIYLLGCDCTYSGHFDESGEKEQVVKPKYFEAYECAKEFCEGKGVKIVNCTRGGMLEVFPRDSLENVLNR